MKNKLKLVDIIIILVVILLTVVTISGVCSFNIDNSYDYKNQYGDVVKIFGSGIYKHDSYFKAPIFIGTDLVMLCIVVPLLVFCLIQNIKKRSIKTKLSLASVIGVVLYYSLSIAFGVTYNVLNLVYIGLFSTSLFSLIFLISQINPNELKEKQKLILPTKKIKVFLTFTAISLFVAWLPDIIISLISNRSLALIEIYTTEVTYVMDMGIVSPLAFICLYFLSKKRGIGDIILVCILRLCQIIGIILPVQTVFQLLAGIYIPIQAIITKVGIFVLLSIFSAYFISKYFKNLKVYF